MSETAQPDITARVPHDTVTIAGLAKWGPVVAAIAIALFTSGVTWGLAKARFESIERDVIGIQLRVAAQDITGAKVIGLEAQLTATAAARAQDRQLLEQLLARVEKLDRRIALLVCKQDSTHCGDE
jgi:hypothetical protein